MGRLYLWLRERIAFRRSLSNCQRNELRIVYRITRTSWKKWSEIHNLLSNKNCRSSIFNHNSNSDNTQKQNCNLRAQKSLKLALIPTNQQSLCRRIVLACLKLVKHNNNNQLRMEQGKKVVQ